MPFEKGKSGNPAGRKVGKKNKTTTEIKVALTEFIGKNIDNLQKKFDSLDPLEQLKFLKDVLKYVIPTQQQKSIDLNNLSEEDLESVVQSLTDTLIE